MLTAQALARGYWTFDAQAPVLVSDPEKFRALLGLPTPTKRRGRQMAETGLLPLSYARRAIERAFPSARRELERLVHGGGQLWFVDKCNIVVNQGLDDLLDVTLSGATQDLTWFVGLTDGTPTVAAGDTLASHVGWTEVANYDEAARVAWVDGGVSGQSVSNTASPATFTISATVTVGGGFLCGVDTGTAGRLYSVAAFTAGDKLLNDNDTLDVTSTATSAAV